MPLKLTPGQGLYLFGLLNFKTTLTWADVINNESLKLDNLLAANLTLQQLHSLQPDIEHWVGSRRVSLHNCPLMVSLWHAQAIADFKADLADIMHMRWPADVMISVGVTYDSLLEAGLTPEIMVKMFSHITLMGWSQKGFVQEHAKCISEASMLRLFGMSKHDVLRSLKAPRSAK